MTLTKIKCQILLICSVNYAVDTNSLAEIFGLYVQYALNLPTIDSNSIIQL